MAWSETLAVSQTRWEFESKNGCDDNEATTTHGLIQIDIMFLVFSLVVNDVIGISLLHGDCLAGNRR